MKEANRNSKANSESVNAGFTLIYFSGHKNSEKLIQSISQISKNRIDLIEIISFGRGANQEGGIHYETLEEACENASKNDVLYFPLDKLCGHINLNAIILAYQKHHQGQCLSIQFDEVEKEHRNISIYKSDLLMVPKEQLCYYFSLNTSIAENRNQFIYFLEESDTHIHWVFIPKTSPFMESGNSFNVKNRIHNWLKWYVKIPLTERKANPNVSLNKEPVIFRFIFLIMAFLLCLTLPFMSLDSAISGDEFVQYEQGKAILDYFVNLGVTEQNKEVINDPVDHLHLYGSSFDLFTAFFNDVFSIHNEYEWRHVFNSLTGWLIILFAGIFTVSIAGWRAGTIALFLMTISPRFIGHSWNNPKDIPFALGYLIGVYYIFKFLKNIEKKKWQHIVAVGLASAACISVRVGGLILFAYLLLFVVLYYFVTTRSIQRFSKEGLTLIRYYFFSILGIVAIGYMVGIMFWPFALEAPLTNPLEALRVMTNYKVFIRQLYNGEMIWSSSLPATYISKYMLITIPGVVFIGFISFFVTIHKPSGLNRNFGKFMLLFALVFPVYYIFYKHSNVYGGWRHAIFVYPMLVIAASIGFDTLIQKIRNRNLQWGGLFLIAILAIHPIKHMLTNHPYQYIYFNELFGGVSNAYAKYETDYYSHSTKEGVDWILKNEDWQNRTAENQLKIGTNNIRSVSYYLRDYKNQIESTYTRYYERSTMDWDYYIVSNNYINVVQMERNIWPPKNAVHVMYVDDVPIGAVLKRVTKFDYKARVAAMNNEFDLAIKYYKIALKEDPYNEVTYLNLGEVCLATNNFKLGLWAMEKVFELYPDYDIGLYFKSRLLLNNSDFDEAMKTAHRLLQVNPKFHDAYYIIGKVWAHRKRYDLALYNLEIVRQASPNFPLVYDAIGHVFISQGNIQEGNRYLNKAKELR